MSEAGIDVNQENRWRLSSPGAVGWGQSARPGAPNKYLMISVDCHANEPADLWRSEERRVGKEC